MSTNLALVRELEGIHEKVEYCVKRGEQYKPWYFMVHELVPESMYKALGEKALGYFDPRVLGALDGLRVIAEHPLYINTWHFSKQTRKALGLSLYNASGLRLGLQNLVGAKYSMHAVGRAFDLKCKQRTLRDIRSRFLAYRDESYLLSTITRLECIDYTETWLHVDMAHINTFGKVYEFTP